MKKLMRCVCLGAPGCGKTTMLLTLNMTDNVLIRPYVPTLEDTYVIQTGLCPADKPLEHVVFYDTAGLKKDQIDIKKSLVQAVDAIKKYLDKTVLKEKKDAQIVLVGTMADVDVKRVSYDTIQQWVAREKVRYFELCTADRSSVIEVVHYVVGRHFHTSREQKFSLSKKLKPERSNAQILMDF